MPILGIQFDVDKVESGMYGSACWEVFWRAVDPEQIRGSALSEGDVAAGHFCIAVESPDAGAMSELRDALAANAAFQAVAADPSFLGEGGVATEPLVPAGQVDAAGSLVGNAYNARPALAAVRRETSAPPDEAAVSVPERAKPASSRTADMPPVSSLEELRELLLTNFGEEEKWHFWLTPEELCDVVEQYSDLLEVQWEQDSSGISEDGTYINLFSTDESRKNITLMGLFAFASEADARSYCTGLDAYPPHLIGRVEELWGIRGKFATNFEGKKFNNPARYEEDKVVNPSDLWATICRRRHALGLPVE